MLGACCLITILRPGSCSPILKHERENFAFPVGPLRSKRYWSVYPGREVGLPLRSPKESGDEEQPWDELLEKGISDRAEVSRRGGGGSKVVRPQDLERGWL